MSVFIADEWLTSAFESLTDYIKSGIDDAVLNDVAAPAGLQVYDVVMEYPTADTLPQPAEFSKTIIHFAVDDIDNRRLGFGEGKTEAVFVEPTVPDPGTVTEAEGNSHEINFDVGIWASDKSGGVTSRLRAYQMLYKLLGTDQAREKCAEDTEGVEIRRFTNGRFIIEKVGDIRTYRMVGAELVVRVFSRTAADPVIFPDEEAAVEPDVEIGGISIVDET